ncbi:MAG: hypothetical protein A3B13_00125 [Candidatus Liptonbacteria bacterium RIFCSPLOWO2_01_FULL_45_15]|uniref:Uncharacterized protein n=1 Tax=Candidatus Liptonbacteria bacterium RIFCSPLOWO2_01_FULL_45_15 TaxID=1798649 RepID=A0A1G2CFN7_9BACT|nr:MAG: hypothetical protein A3B13_00125 [Candidatus Liptonbacteria bacterium RIFCSPLOWO2_01_FULL_45_15]
MEPSSKEMRKDEGMLHPHARTKLGGMNIFAGSSLAIKGDMVGKYKIEGTSGYLRKLATVIERHVPPTEINSWVIIPVPPATLATTTGIEDELGRSAVTLLARVHQVISLGKKGPGNFGRRMANLHFVKYKREKLALHWWTVGKRLYIDAREPVLAGFWKKGLRVHSA